MGQRAAGESNQGPLSGWVEDAQKGRFRKDWGLGLGLPSSLVRSPTTVFPPR